MRRILLAAPLFILAAMMLVMKFDVLWRYVSWCNQVLATFTFFAISQWLYTRSHSARLVDTEEIPAKAVEASNIVAETSAAATAAEPYNRFTWLIAYFPAVFMLAVSSSFIMISSEGFRLPYGIGFSIAAVITVVFSLLFLRKKVTSVSK